MNTKIIKYGTATAISLFFLGSSFILIILNIWRIKYSTLFGYDIIQEFFNNAPNLKLTENLLIVKKFYDAEIDVGEAVRILTLAQIQGNTAVICAPIFVISVISFIVFKVKYSKLIANFHKSEFQGETKSI